MTVSERMSNAGIVPVVVLENAADAVPTARALMAGKVDVMEITFRTDAAEDSIRAVAEQCEGMVVGAGTVVNLEQCKRAVAAGAQFIVSPGYDEEVVAWCVENQVTVVPGCVTPTEIMAAMKHGLKVLKFFPASVYGGLSAMKALSAPFGSVRFVPTGGVNEKNCGEYSSAPFIHAIGGSWVCTKQDIAAHNFEKITQLCLAARAAILGFEVAHIGVNCSDEAQAQSVCGRLTEAFGFPAKVGSSSIFSSDAIEVMKSCGRGVNGHIAIRTNKVSMAVAELESRGFHAVPETIRCKGDRMTVAYLEGDFGGFAVHLVQR